MDWSAFEALPSDPKRNFEIVARAAVAHAFGRYGTLRGSRQQPGVEFYLVLDQECPLGGPPRVVGWQCKYYGDPGYLNTTRRKVIADGVEKAFRHVPGLTDFVLWTKLPLRDSDAAWLGSLSDELTFRSWHQDDLERLLVGDALAVRAAFFGDQVIIPDQLERRYTDQLAHISDRFELALHVDGDDLRVVRHILGDPAQWRGPLRHGDPDNTTEKMLARLAPGSPYLTQDEIDTLATSVVARHSTGDDAPAAIAEGRLTELLDDIETLPPPLGDARLHTASDSARAAGDTDAVQTIGWLWDMESTADRRLESAAQTLSEPMLALVGEAGVGKTHLAATLAASEDDRPSGLLVLGNQFTRELNAAALTAAMVPGAPDLDSALDALNAAAQRSGRRLPLVLDGLNESDDPFAWKPLLTTLRTAVQRRSHLLVVLTVRPDYAERCLPSDITTVQVGGFTRWQVEEAVPKYFAAYKIDADVEHLPWLTFELPLMLRIFCEAINPNRVEVVRVEDVPDGQAAVFDLFVDRLLRRVGERDPRRDLDHARSRIAVFARTLWHDGRRSLSQVEVKALFGDDEARWEGTLIQRLLTEGLLRRDPPPPGSDDPTEQQISFIYDLLGGYLVAKAVVADPATDLADPALAERLVVGGSEAHPMAQDIVTGIEATLARAGEPSLWRVTPSVALRRESLLRTLELPISQIGTGATNVLATELLDAPELLPRVVPRVFRNYLDESDPFNLVWFDRVLRPMSVWQRDFAWTESVRGNDRFFGDEVRAWSAAAEDPDTSLDMLQTGALFLSWSLTTTDRALRDEATFALRRIGLRQPSILLNLAIDRLDVNDPYVVERIMGATYGMFMANTFPSEDLVAAAEPFLEALHARVYAIGDGSGIAHWITRTHIEGMVAFTNRHLPKQVPKSLRDPAISLPAPPGPAKLIDRESGDREEAARMLGMDFENYTIGALTPDRANYDEKNPEHQTRIAEVLGRAWELGWRNSRFGEIDRQIAREGSPRELDPAQVERYGKKYTWIGYYEAAGRLDAAGALVDEFSGARARLSDARVDPSFPEPPPAGALPTPYWVGDAMDDENWIRHGRVEVPLTLMRFRDDAERTWVSVYGDVSQTGEGDPARRVFALLRLVLVPRGHWEALARDLLQRPHLERRALPDASADYYTYGGEIPWAAHFALDVDEERSAWLSDRSRVPAEILAHTYAWESYHSVLNEAGGTLVPSRPFSAAFGLCGGGPGLDQFLPDGQRASLSLRAPEGMDGNILCVREDLIRRYAEERDMDVGLIVWGERLVSFGGAGRSPDWFGAAVVEGANLHRLAYTLDELLTEAD